MRHYFSDRKQKIASYVPITLALKRLRQEDHKFQTKEHGQTGSNKTKQQPPKKAKKNNTDTDFKIIFVFTVEEKVKKKDNGTLCM